MVILVFVVFVSDKSTRSHDSVVVPQGYHHRKCVVSGELDIARQGRKFRGFRSKSKSKNIKHRFPGIDLKGCERKKARRRRPKKMGLVLA